MLTVLKPLTVTAVGHDTKSKPDEVNGRQIKIHTGGQIPGNELVEFVGRLLARRTNPLITAEQQNIVKINSAPEWRVSNCLIFQASKLSTTIG